MCSRIKRFFIYLIYVKKILLVLLLAMEMNVLGIGSGIFIDISLRFIVTIIEFQVLITVIYLYVFYVKITSLHRNIRTSVYGVSVCLYKRYRKKRGITSVAVLGGA